jgi:alkylation response protein AidB-like acyl-CoA dehydrogenase
MDRYELRRLDYSLTDDHRQLQTVFREFFSMHCSIDVVRAAETTGFDKSLWERLCAVGATTMALPESCGGDGATLVDLSLVAEEIGRTLAPVPWIDHVCASRLLARLGSDADPSFRDLLTGVHIAGLDSRLVQSTGPRLVPAGSVANLIVVQDGSDVIGITVRNQPEKVDNLASLPMAWIDPGDADERRVLARGAVAVKKYQLALQEWRVLTSAALVGLVEEALRIAVDFAKTRYTLGVPIATLQAISHPLADIAITVDGARNLTRRAAWFLDNEPDERPELALAAFVFLAEEAAAAATTAAHVQGGLGVTTEAAASAYLLRARGWSLAGGDPAEAAKQIAEIVAGRELAEAR